MTIKIYDPSNNALGFLNNVFDLKITKEISGMEEMSFYVPINSYEASLIQLEGYLYPEGEQLFVIREVNQHGNDIEVFCTLAIENLYGYCWEAITKKSISLVDAFEYAIQYTGWKFVNRSSKPATTRDIHIQNQTVWEALQVLCEVFFVEITVDTHTHTITVYDRVGEDTGTFFISDMNLVNFRKDMSTHKLITRLIPIGKDGLRISSVNGGKEYIDNNKYSNKLLYGLWIQTAYTNPQQLKEDATKMLEEYARPYVTYNVDIVDLYRKTGNQLFKFGIGDTVTLIDKLSEEKAQQRVVKMEIYPHNPQLNNIELSNKNKTFQDYFKMIQLMNNMANHFISTNGSYTGTGDSNINKTPSVDSVGNVHIQNGSISTDKIQADSITTDKLVANSITTDKLQANSIATNHLQANSITTDKLQANSISTDKLQANSISTDKLQANSITSNKIQAKSIKAEHLQSNIIDSDKIFADAITSDKIQAGAITTDKLDANVVNTNHLIANSVTADKIKSNNITTEHLQAGSVVADKIGAESVTADKIQAGAIDSIHIKSESIDSGHIKADVITTEHLQAGSITSGSGIIANGAIGDAQISSLTAGKITSGTIDTSKVTVSGANSNLKISGNRLQVFNGTGSSQVERVSIGDVNGNGSVYGLRVRGADGKTILLDENGVKSEGITDGSITNSKISDSAQIDGEKLNINSVVNQINKDGTTSIKGVKVLVNNTNLETSLSNITTKQTEHTNKITQHESSIKANQDAIKLKVDTQTYSTDKSNMTTQMNKNTSAISVLEKEIELKVEQSDINTAINTVTNTIDTKINTAKSEIKATTDSITQRVQSTETTTKTLQTNLSNTTSKIDNLKVGSNNLVTNSRFHSDYNTWTCSSKSTTSFTTEDGKSCCKVNHTALKMSTIFSQPILSKVIPGETYTMSGWVKTENIVKGSTNFLLGFYADGKYNNNGTDTWFGAEPSSRWFPINTGEGEWEHFYFTFTFPKDKGKLATIFTVYLYFRDFTGQVYFRDVKLELGNKATDWTPAPEDFQTQIDSNKSEISTTKSKVATVETNLSGITSKVSSVETKTSTLEGKVTEQESRIKTAESKITDSAIINTVSSTIDAKVNSGINNLNIGGRNLLKASNVNITNSSSYMMRALYFGDEPPVAGQKYTISIKGSLASTKTGFGIYNSGGTVQLCVLKEEDNHNGVYSKTFNWVITSGEHTSANTYIQIYQLWSSQTGSSTIEWVKLEKGNKVTDWTPAPEDIESKVDSQYSELKQTANDITATVSDLNGKYTQIKQTVDSIDLTGKVSFSDLSTQGKTTIHGANITTGTVNGNLIQGGTIKGSLLQTYANDSTKGVRIMAEAMQLNDTSIFFGGDGRFNIQASKGFNVASMADIYLMPGLLASGTPSGNGTVVIPNATLRAQKLYVVNDTSMDGALRVGGNISCGGNIIGKGNTQLGRTSIYLPRLGSSVTTDYLRLGTGYISMTDTGAFHFIPTSGSTNFTMARGSVWLPGASGNVTTDHFGIGYGYMCCVDSGNFHFITKGGVSASLYAKTTVASYSLEDTIESRSSKKALDVISEVPVVNTEDGYRLASPKTKSIEATNVVNTSIEEETGKETISTDYNSVLATMWKAIQELQAEVKELKQENEELRSLLNKGE